MVEPKTDIRLLRGVPLDTSYNHTIRFTNATEQSTYFANKTKHTLSKQTYQRVNRGYAKVGLSADECYECNYMMFRNTGYGSKWFYAFITSVEYLNDNACYITFQIDVMQTWLFDYNIRDCMVIREHQATDEVGENILPEPVQLGEYVQSSGGSTNILKNLAVILAICDQQETVVGNVFEGTFSGCAYYAYNINSAADVEALKVKVLDYTQSPDSIVGMWMCPLMFCGTIDSDHRMTSTEKGTSYDSEEGDITPLTPSTSSLNGYMPKNKKLYTYLYNYLQLDNGCDNSLVLRYEFFENLAPMYHIEGTRNAPVKACVYPTHYKGSKDKPYRMESLNMASYPMCSWNNDAYKVWLAQNSYINNVKMAQTVINSVVSAAGTLSSFETSMANTKIASGTASSSKSAKAITATGENSAYEGLQSGLIGAVMNPINEVINQQMNNYSASIQADLFRGTLGNSNLLVAMGENKLFYRRMSIPYNYAQTIDDFFTIYGYATNRKKQPNVCSGTGLRPHWNYIQTSGAVARGSVPAPDLKAICMIFDSGITFWENGEEVGNYSYDNSPS